MVCLMLLVSLPSSVYASPINYTYLLANNFTSESNQWTKVGYSPYYLTLQDQPINFIFTTTYPITDEKYTFQDISPTKKTLVSVEFRAYHRINAVGGQQYIGYYFWDGNSYVTDFWYGVGYGDSGWLWTSWADITFFINTWDKVNDLATKIISNIIAEGPFGTANYVDCIEIKVGWEPIVQWENIENWYGVVSTMEWLNAESWLGILSVRKWFNAEMWRGTFETFVYHIVEIWKTAIIYGMAILYYIKLGIFGTGMLLIASSVIAGAWKRSNISGQGVGYLIFAFFLGVTLLIGGMTI